MKDAEQEPRNFIVGCPRRGTSLATGSSAGPPESQLPVESSGPE